MSYCINPTCPAPDKNSPTTNFCMSCGAKILLKDRYRYYQFDVSTDAWVWRDYLVDNPVDEKLGKVLDKMIANSLNQRYLSAEEVLAALEPKPNRFNTLFNPAIQAPHRVPLKLVALEQKSDRFNTLLNPAIQAPHRVPLKLDAQGIFAAFRRGQRVFSEMNLSSLDLSKAYLPGITLSIANCAYINLQSANLSRSKFDKADLSGAVLKNTDLSLGFFSYANLQNADLRGADLSEADLNHANLNGANLCGANLKGAKVTKKQLNQAKTNFMTIFPNGKRGGFW